MKRNHSILVVDDEKTIADGLRLTLESEGYGVRTAGSVREALTAVLQGDSHAAIVDLMLPDGDGLHLTRELKRRDPAIEVIVITAYGSVRKAMEATRSRSTPTSSWASSRTRSSTGSLSARTRTSSAGSSSR